MKKEEVFEIPPKVTVFEDPKTRAKSIAIPFQFPTDGVNGLIIISRLKGFSWQPAEHIKSVTLTFTRNGNTPTE